MGAAGRPKCLQLPVTGGGDVFIKNYPALLVIFL